MSATVTAPATAPASPPAGPVPPHGRPRPVPLALNRLVVNGILALGIVYTFLPVTWLLFAATKDRQDMVRTGGFEFGTFRLWENIEYTFAYGDGIIVRWMLNSLVYALGGGMICAFVCLLGGYAFDKFTFPAKGKFFGVVLMATMVPMTVLAMPIYLLGSEIGATNTYWGMLLPSMFGFLPFGLYMSRVFSSSHVPDEIVEAARMDGAGEFAIFLRIALPTMRSPFMTLLLLSFNGIWNDFYTPLLMLSDHELYPLSLGIYGWFMEAAAHPELYPMIMVGSVVSLIPVVALFLSLQKYWKSGLTTGAVK
ncbi:carbohydrate ABC transporter permease [Streptomyces sp. FIT100]|uniref:carbohydrate ABC transporter permease n=1 Tax=Streptomyces sp. FIT100 TaxID=2837956 RepID=UPI0021C5676F|nr:carbohydrate ABC transporter permease [Streptomyces sp. FIT100]UUN29785.1 carbohydrate ABC transporter permease [Streptomyces sp. FIT100]